MYLQQTHRAWLKDFTVLVPSVFSIDQKTLNLNIKPIMPTGSDNWHTEATNMTSLLNRFTGKPSMLTTCNTVI